MWSLSILLLIKAAQTNCVAINSGAARHDAERVATLITTQPPSPINRLLLPLAAVESRLDSDALSHAGAKGLLQITPIAEKHVHMFPSDRWVPRTQQGYINRLYDPEYNVNIGAAYLRYCWGIAGVSLPGRRLTGTLACYNGGHRQLNNLRLNQPLATETAGYIKKVLQLARRCSIITLGEH